MNMNNINAIKEYEEYIKYVSFITIIKSRKRVKENNNCLLVFNHKHYYYDDQKLIDQIDDIIINYLKKYIINYELTNDYNIPLYTYLFTSDKLVNFLLKYCNYDINYLYKDEIVIEYCKKRYGEERFNIIRDILKSKTDDYGIKKNNNTINGNYELIFNTMDDICVYIMNNILKLDEIFNNYMKNQINHINLNQLIFNILLDINKEYKKIINITKINNIINNINIQNNKLSNNKLSNNKILDKFILYIIKEFKNKYLYVQRIRLILNRLKKIMIFIIETKEIIYLNNIKYYLELFIYVLTYYINKPKLKKYIELINNFDTTLNERYDTYYITNISYDNYYIVQQKEVEKKYTINDNIYNDIFNNDYNNIFIKYLSTMYDCKISNSVIDISPITHIYFHNKYNLLTNMNNYMEDIIYISQIYEIKTQNILFNYDLNNFIKFFNDNKDNNNDIYYNLAFLYNNGNRHALVLYIDKKYKLILLLNPHGMSDHYSLYIYNFLLEDIQKILINNNIMDYKIIQYKYLFEGIQIAEINTIIKNIKNKSNFEGYCYFFCLLYIECYYLLKDILNNYIQQNDKLDIIDLPYLLNYYIYKSINNLYKNNEDINIVKFINCYANRFPLLTEYNNPLINAPILNSFFFTWYDYLKNDNTIVNNQNIYTLYNKDLLNKSINYHLSHYNY